MSEKIPFKKEYYLHSITQKNLKELFGLEFVASEIQLHDLRFDNLAFDEKTDSFVIIEYKNELNLNVLNQTKDYYDLLLNNKDEYIRRYNEEFKTSREEDDFDFENTKVLIVGPKFTTEQIEASENPSYPFELWKVTLYDNNCVVYENLSNNEKKQLKINEDDLKVTEEALLSDKSDEMMDLYNYLKEHLLSDFRDIDLNFQVDQFSFRANGKLVCVVRFLKSSFMIYLYGDNLENAERTDDISDKDTGGIANYQFKYESDEDYEYFLDLFGQAYNQKVQIMKICPACEKENESSEEYCLNCGQRLIEEVDEDEILTDKLKIPKDKIILLDLNYTLISNSWAIRYERLPEKIFNRKYEDELVELIKDNYVILITASPYYTSYDSLKHIEENTDLKIRESYWNFGKRPPELKRYWLEKAVIPEHGDDPSKYLAIESNPKTREMYAEFDIEARPKTDFIGD